MKVERGHNMSTLFPRIGNRLFRLLYMPICRAYARYVLGDKPADLMMRILCSVQFYRVNGIWPHFINPQLFSEKLWHRMLYNRNPLLTLISDKLNVRDYVSQKIGKDYLIPIIWHGENPESIPFDDLPDKFVIKTNHGCSYNIIVNNKGMLDQNKTKKQLKKWLEVNYCTDKWMGIEWGYKHVKPTILIETMIEENGNTPVDYKFYCFSGAVECVTVHLDRFVEHKTKTFDRNFSHHEFRYNLPQWHGTCRRPLIYDSMVNVAEILSRDFQFLRVDLYCIGNKIYFSELTPYPGGISLQFLPLEQDRLFGQRWQCRGDKI